MPAVVNDRCLMVQTVQKTVEIIHSCSTSEGGRCPCCVVVKAPQLHVETAEITQLQVVVDSSLYGGAVGTWVFSPVLRAFFALRPFGR